MCNLLYSFPYNRCTACAGGSPWAHLEGWQSCKERTSRGSEGALHEPLPGAQGKGGGWWRRDVLKKESAWNGFCMVLLCFAHWYVNYSFFWWSLLHESRTTLIKFKMFKTSRANIGGMLAHIPYLELYTGAKHPSSWATMIRCCRCMF